MDHLLHTIADTLMDGYQPFLDRLESEASQLEDEALFDPQADILERISNIRTELLQARRYLTPQREALLQLARGEYAFIGRNIQPYFRDVLDHLVRITEDIDLYRDQVTSARELFMSTISQKSNESIKIFTVIATLMMPPTLIASVYGMNFKLWPSGYFEHAFWIVVGVMVLIRDTGLVFPQVGMVLTREQVSGPDKSGRLTCCSSAAWSCGSFEALLRGLSSPGQYPCTHKRTTADSGMTNPAKCVGGARGAAGGSS